MVRQPIDRERTYTAAEFMATVGSDPNWELIEGKIQPVCAAAWDTSRLTGRLLTYLTMYVETRGLGSVWGMDGSFRIERTPDSVLLPDIAFVLPGRITAQAPGTYFDGTPDLAVEVRSPSDRMAAVARKMERYLAAGSHTTWLIDPQKRHVHVKHRGTQVARALSDDEVLLGDTLISGFALPLPVLFDIFGPLRSELVLPLG